jgi:hypothetical protein
MKMCLNLYLDLNKNKSRNFEYNVSIYRCKCKNLKIFIGGMCLGITSILRLIEITY